jgi:eukaryotic-like serine/threonine-protein kinase
MPRSRIGPLALESPLGGRGTSMFRAVHVQQRTQCAVRVLSVPLGLTVEAKKRFQEDAERLKALRHDRIARCYGGGTDGNDVYVVHELINGESLAAVLARQGRLSWETALKYGLEMCDAMQHAHNAGWLHASLSPDQLICEFGGESIKILGFRGDLVRKLSNRPRTPEELAYQAPEQFTPPVTPHPAIDIYSMGAILYHALTGSPPFKADSLEQLRQQVTQVEPQPVASIVFDCPVWLSKIVEQLLQKNPVQRPFTAAAVAMALREAEKRAMSGASVMEHALSGFSPLQMNLNKDEAEKALGIKPKKKKKASADQPFFERPIVLVGALIAIAIVLVIFMQPASEASLRRKAERLMANKDRLSYITARDDYLTPMLDQYPDGEHAQWAREQLDIIDMDKAESEMERHDRFNQDPNSEGERRYSEARRYERFGDRITALEKHKAFVELYKDNTDERPYVNLSRRQIREIEKDAPDKAKLLDMLNAKLDEADLLFESGDVVGATKIWDSILSLYNGNAEMVSVVARAKARLDRMKEAAASLRANDPKPETSSP